MKRRFLILLTAVFIVTSCIPAYAAEVERLSGHEQETFLEELELCVQEGCSGHPSFVRYLVREDGWYAVYANTSESADAQEGVFSRAYIDVFNSNAEFIAEISFRTRDELTLNFSHDTLDIYLSEYRLSVDLTTYEVTVSQTSRYYAKENGLHEKFTQKTQEAAGWRYSCKGSSMNYTSLVRANGDVEEVLLSLSGNIPGTEQTVTSFVAKGILSAGILLAAYLVWKVKRRHSQSKQ